MGRWLLLQQRHSVRSLHRPTLPHRVYCVALSSPSLAAKTDTYQFIAAHFFFLRYFHTVGDRGAHSTADQYTANGGWSVEHQALCQVAPDYRFMSGCSDGYLPVTELHECETAKAVLAPDLPGVTQKGFGSEWANGCFVNAGAVYFHTRGDQSAHDSPTDYVANGGWSNTHQALCKRDPALQQGH